MSNMRIIAVNDADAATITASPDMTGGLPVTHLQNPTRARMARTTSLADQDILLTWDYTRIITSCAMLRHNLTSSATWRLRLYSDAAWTDEVYDSGESSAIESKSLDELDWGVDPLGMSIFTGWPVAFSTLYLAAHGAMSAKITLHDPTNPDGYMQASRLFMGAHFEPAYNPSYGLTLGWDEDTKNTRTAGGSLRSDPTDKWRVMNFDLDAIVPEDRQKVMEIFRELGINKDFFISMFPSRGGMLERDYTLQAKMARSGTMALPKHRLYSTKIQLEEV